MHGMTSAGAPGPGRARAVSGDRRQSVGALIIPEVRIDRAQKVILTNQAALRPRPRSLVSGHAGVILDDLQYPLLVLAQGITVLLGHHRRAHERLARRGPQGGVEHRPGQLVQRAARTTAGSSVWSQASVSAVSSFIARGSEAMSIRMASTIGHGELTTVAASKH